MLSIALVFTHLPVAGAISEYPLSSDVDSYFCYGLLCSLVKQPSPHPVSFLAVPVAYIYLCSVWLNGGLLAFFIYPICSFMN